MNSEDFAAAAAALAAARRSAQRIGGLPPGWLPAGLDEALRLQRAAAAALGPARGWKISGLTPAQQQAMGVECPLSGPLLEPWVHASGATLQLADFIAPRLECEFAFELGTDLPARREPYARGEVEAAIAALRIAVEVVDSRLPASSGPWMELADGLNNGAFVVGPRTPRWRSLAYAGQAITLRSRRSGTTTEIAHGDGRAVLDGDPVGAVLLLANLPPHPARELRAGDVVTTGSCTGAVAVPGAGDIEADFGALGMVRVRFAG